MATRYRKTRKNRGSRTCGWGQVGQHRASGHRGGLGSSGMLKHHFSSMLRDDPDHFGHESTHTPRNLNLVKSWACVRDLDDIYAKIGKDKDGKKTIDLTAAGYDKLLGGGSTFGAYSVKVRRCTKSAKAKLEKIGGDVTVMPLAVPKEVSTKE
ncbi:MAG: ribosomal protein L15 [Cenarchaeum symbiont of Oopsacas minuta]|nr:ribosomal protein L15 [Cenarchaeum symbiont of Oopsacas minuta]